jgi:hypothetical protein
MVFGVLTVDSGLLLILLSSSLYSRLRGTVNTYFDGITTMLMRALSRCRHAPGDTTPCILVSYRGHATEVLKRYAPDKNQAIQCMVSCQAMCQMKLELRHLIILKPVVGTSANPSQVCLLQIKGSP